MYTNSYKTCFTRQFFYVHEKVILLDRSRLRALVVLVFAHDMQTQVAYGVCKQGCRLISYTANKRLVTIETCVAPTFVTSTTFVTAHQFCQFISTAFVNLTTFVNFVNSELTSFVSNINHLCRYRRGHYFCQQGPTTFVNRNFMILPMCAMLSHTLK